MNSLITLTDNLRSKILTLNDLELLEEMVTFSRQIYLLVARIVSDYCKEQVTEGHKRPAHFYPLIRQARQMEIFLLLCDINTTLYLFTQISQCLPSFSTKKLEVLRQTVIKTY